MARGTERGSRRGNNAGPALAVSLLGPLTLSRDDRALALPASRKARALLAYLALAPRPLGRSQLCELLWDGPSDPRGELRWCLSRIRALLDAPGRRRVVATDDTIALDLSDASVDAIAVEQAMRAGVETLTLARQRALADAFRGEFLENLEIEHSSAFGNWLTAQRRRFRACRAALLEQLASRADDDAAFGYLEQWLQLAPFDRRVHERLLQRLAARGRIHEGEGHMERTMRLFESEGLDAAPLRECWRAARSSGQTVVSVAAPPSPGEGSAASRRASIAVMPFTNAASAASERGGMADALAHDVTTRLARLRSMFVIAQGSTFALAERRIGPEEAGRMLNVDYVVGGVVRQQARRLAVTVELVETRTARIVWSELLNHDTGDAFALLDEIGDRIVASIASEIETIERNRAILRPPNSLDAWESHHRGLWHMYRFTRADNDRARHFFGSAVRLDPTFARAYAGLSFTHFQNAFLGWGRRAAEIDRAFETAGQSLMVDERDPAAHWAMGRALWLRGRSADARVELRRTIELAPNFALGHYTLAFVEAQSGDPQAAIHAADVSRALSPYDPLLFGMLGSRAMALARLGRYEEAAAWAVKAAARPNAHPHIYAIAACTLALAGSLDEARTHAGALRRARPAYGIRDFLDAFRFEADGAALFRRAGRLVGLA